MCTILAPAALAVPVSDVTPFATNLIKEYLIVTKTATINPGVNLTTTSNTLGFVPNLAPSAPSLPSGAPSPQQGSPSYDGDVASLAATTGDPFGQVQISNEISVYGDTDQGVVCNTPTSSCPNLPDATFDNNDGNGLQPFAVDRGLEQFGSTTTAALADITGQVNSARAAINAMKSVAADQTLTNADVSTIGGAGDFTVTLNDPGLNIIKFDPNVSGDITVVGNFIFDAPMGATPGDRQAILYIPDSANLLTSNGNIIVGSNRIGLMDVLIVSTRQDNASHFSFSNTILNGISFWDIFRSVGETSSDSSELVWNNVTGCTQILGDKINLSSEIHLSNCGFRGVSVPTPPDPSDLPEPGTLTTLGFGLLGLGWVLRRRRHAA